MMHECNPSVWEDVSCDDRVRLDAKRFLPLVTYSLRRIEHQAADDARQLLPTR